MTRPDAAVPLGAPSLRDHPRGLLVAMHLPFVAFTAAQAAADTGPRPRGAGAIGIALVLAAAALQLRHSLAAARGRRPRHWRASLGALLAIACAPPPLYTTWWSTLPWFGVASWLMLVPGPRATFAAVVATMAWTGWRALTGLPTGPSGAGLVAWAFVYGCAVLLAGGFGLYGAARLVRLADELGDTRAELAARESARERLRISRDLHDLLGQSLAAVSLKGELAMRLLARRDAARAGSEIESLVAVARSALHDLRDLAHREAPIALTPELERAGHLLASIGVDTRVDVADAHVPRAVDALFGWALREGVTNVLRHSTATTCAITVSREGGAWTLRVVNDGVTPAGFGGRPGVGHGVPGLAARSAALGGSVRAGALGAREFELRVTVPAVAPGEVPAEAGAAVPSAAAPGGSP